MCRGVPQPLGGVTQPQSGRATTPASASRGTHVSHTLKVTPAGNNNKPKKQKSVKVPDKRQTSVEPSCYFCPKPCNVGW